MKKLISVFTLIVVFSVSAFSQEKGRISLEATLDPSAIFDASGGPLFQMPYIKARYFLADDLAIGLGLDIDRQSQVTNPSNRRQITSSSTFIGISPSFEKHFPVGKVSPFVGAGVMIGMQMAKGQSVTRDTIGGTPSSITIDYTNDVPPGFAASAASFAFGVNGIVGADYYINDNLYVGMQFTFGYSNTNYKKQETTTTSVFGGTTTITKNTTAEEWSRSSFAFSGFSGLRVGIRF